MNERIRELARQSTGAGTTYMLEEEWLKFAELIIRECLEKVHECVQTRDTSRYYPDSDGRKIKEHFGVE